MSMNQSEHEAFLYNVLMSQYTVDDDEIKNAGKEYIQHDTSNDVLYQCYTDKMSIDMAKEILKNDYLQDANDYRLVTDISGISVVCTLQDGSEKVFHLKNEDIDDTTETVINEEMHTIHTSKPIFLIILLRVLLAVAGICTVLLILILTKG